MTTTPTRSRRGATLLGLLLLFAAPAGGQQPSPEQIAAVRQSCRSDYIEHCSSVPTGGAASLDCLRQNEAHLSAACRQAVAAIGGAGAPPRGASTGGGAAAPHAGGGGSLAAGTPPHAGGPELFREECGTDVRRICRGVLPGGGRMIACLAENREQLSPGCREAMMELRERR